METRGQLLRRVQIAAFAAHEANLYLDTHPQDRRALEYFRKYTEMAHRLTQEYEKKYGPVSVDSVSGNSWTWVNAPWPWELEANS